MRLIAPLRCGYVNDGSRSQQEERPMKIVIPGGSGQVGTVCARALSRDGHQVVVLSRRPAGDKFALPKLPGTAKRGTLDRRVRSGRCRDQPGRNECQLPLPRANRRRILDSRVRSTRSGRPGHCPANVRRESGCKPARPPSTPIATTRLMTRRPASWADTNRAPRDTWRFSIDVAKAWEQAAREAEVPHTRQVLLRSAMTMSPDPAASSIRCWPWCDAGWVAQRRRPAIRVMDS